jgi:hypothetical protein
MKYKDKGFLKYQEKQRDGEVGYWSQKSDRQIRREREHRFSTFYQKFLISKIDKYWWKNLRDSDKEKIISLHYLQEDAISTKDLDRWYSEPVFDTWSEWFDYVRTTFEPNKIQLREDKLRELGIYR